MSEKYRTIPFYNGVSTFKAAFPDLADAVIEWREKRGPEDDKVGELRRTSFRRGNFTQGIVPCSNPHCHEGGYVADRLVADMLRLGETEREGMLLCSGREVGDEVRRGPVRCPHRMHFKATLVPRSPEERAPAAQRPGPPDRDRRGNNRRSRQRPPRRRDVA